MATKKSKQVHEELAWRALRWHCDPDKLEFTTTDEVEPLQKIVGQERAIRALQYGLSLDIGTNPFAHIFVTGMSGTGRETLVKRELERLARDMYTLTNRAFGWVYVTNIHNPTQPIAIRFRAGEAQEFKEHIANILGQIQEYARSAPDLLRQSCHAFEQTQYDLFMSQLAKINEAYKEQAEKLGEDIVTFDLGENPPPYPASVLILKNNRQLKGNEITPEQLQTANQIVRMYTLMQQVIMKFAVEEQAKLFEPTNLFELLEHFLEHWKTKNVSPDDLPAQTRIVKFLETLLEYTVKNFRTFVDYEQKKMYADPNKQGVLNEFSLDTTDPYLPFRVNVVVQPATEELPVIVETRPTYINLFGKIGTRFFMGRQFADHTMIHAGSLHAANGGFIIINALDLLKDPVAWDALKHTIKTRSIVIRDRFEEIGFLRSDTELKPEAIPFRCKIVLLGTPSIYYLLKKYDPDFEELFEIHAPFDFEMPLTSETLREYSAFVSLTQHQKQLLPFHKEAVAKIIEEAVRCSGKTKKISTQFGKLQRLIVEAGLIANSAKAPMAEKAHVDKALKAQEERASLIADKVREQISGGLKLIETRGEKVGQINALAIIELPDYTFGIPLRISAQTYIGKAGIVSVEREAKLSGPLLDKTFSIIQGYIGGTYGKNRVLAVNASVAFEQSYAMSDGDSPSLAGTSVVLSSLSHYPIKQSVAITGSMDQFGNVQPVGGINEKIEAFFTVCKERGLDGMQGIIIPEQNVVHLMLNEEVVEAVRKKRFHIWPVKHIDEVLEILMDVQVDEIHRKVREELSGFARIATRREDTSGVARHNL